MTRGLLAGTDLGKIATRGRQGTGTRSANSSWMRQSSSDGASKTLSNHRTVRSITAAGREAETRRRVGTTGGARGSTILQRDRDPLSPPTNAGLGSRRQWGSLPKETSCRRGSHRDEKDAACVLTREGGW